MRDKMVGILGGVGPLATVYFMEMLVRMTDARADQEHIDAVVFQHASIPDRTKYILGQSGENPLDKMTADAQKLEAMGASFLVLPCNTAHYFFDSIQQSVSIPMLNIVEEAVRYAAALHPGLRRVGILATDGTIATHTYQAVCAKNGLEAVAPEREDQRTVMEIIYSQVKAGAPVDMDAFHAVAARLRRRGCGAVILGCTELSVLYRDFQLDSRFFVDSLEVLAKRTIYLCGRRIKSPRNAQRERAALPEDRV